MSKYDIIKSNAECVTSLHYCIIIITDAIACKTYCDGVTGGIFWVV